MKQEKGQIIIILLLVMLVALAVGLAIAQRSITNVSLSTKTEQSSRAFSAAEAGIERAIESDTNALTIPDLGNQATATVEKSGELPLPLQALEYPPINKAEFAQFWFVDPEDSTLASVYDQSRVRIYFGNAGTPGDTIPHGELGYNPSDEKPAIEVNLIIRDSLGSYRSIRTYYDADNTRTSGPTGNNFNIAGVPVCDLVDPFDGEAINTSNSSNETVSDRRFLCRIDHCVKPLLAGGCQVPTTPAANQVIPILARVRLLYSKISQKIAFKPLADGAGGNGASCDPSAPDNSDCSLPPQAEIFTSVGVSGETQRKLQAFREKKVVPHLLDFALFSTGDLEKF